MLGEMSLRAVIITALNDISVLNQKSHTKDPNKMRGSKEFLCIHFFSVNFMSSFHKDHVGNYDTRLSLEERNLKPFIWVSTSQSVPREMQNLRHLKLTKKFFTLSPFLKNNGLICEPLTSYCGYCNWGVMHVGYKVEFACY